VVTFDRHPAMVVRPDSAPKLLTDLDQKLGLLASTGVDYTVVIHFDEARSKESAEDFVNEVLVGCLGARSVVVGHDFHFGHGRRGNVALLQEMGGSLGFDVLGLRLVGDGTAVPYSSTRVRELLAEGDVAGAAAILDRPHEVRGLIVDGDRRGRELGFPTANVAVPGEICLPADGIYAGWYLRPDGSRHMAALSLGRRPTFYEEADSSLLEAYLLDFSDDLYGEPARVQFVARLRGEVKFDSVDALVEQMNADVAEARRHLTP
jgi:riboflavin kinase/FMN adenylyltransferase